MAIDEKMAGAGPEYTPYPEVNLILGELLPAAREILAGNFTGAYLFGSLAAGGFDRGSDVDVLVVTETPVAEAAFAALRALHERIARIDSSLAFELEVI